MNVKKLDSIILEVLEEFKHPISEAPSDETQPTPISLKGSGNLDAEKIHQTRIRNRETDTNRALDILQTILDWVGFIPGWGDILDAINAIIYFIRGRQLEGYLSLIAIIPVIGSGLKLAFKGTIQSIGGAIAFNKILKQAQRGNVTGLADFYRVALDSGKLNKVQLSQLANYGDEVAKLLVAGKSSIGTIEQALKLDPATLKQVYKQIDEMAALVRNTTAIPAKQSLKMPGGNLLKKGVDAIAKPAGNIINTTLNIATFGGFSSAMNLVKKLGISNRELMQLRKAMDVKFVKQVENSTLLTTSLFKQLKRPGAAQSVGDIGVPPWLWSKKTKDIDAWFDNLKKTDPMKWKQVSSNVANASKSVENPYYVKMASNYFQQAGNIFQPGAVFSANKGDILSSLVKLDTYRLSNPKNLDIVANEIEDLAEKIGLDPKDDANSVIVSALYLSVMNLVKKYAPEIATAAAGTTAVTDMIGITDFGTDSKEAGESVPGGEVITVSDDLVEIKDDFKSFNGTTSERLENLKQQGYSDAEIMKLKRELDID